MVDIACVVLIYASKATTSHEDRSKEDITMRTRALRIRTLTCICRRDTHEDSEWLTCAFDNDHE